MNALTQQSASNIAELTNASVRYWEEGSGPTLVFVHGLLVNANLWRNVIPPIAAAGFRCITPNWPLGAHDLPVPHADLTPPGVAAILAEFIERLDLDEVTIVANDTGGAITQILMTNHPERIASVVLTPSDSFERFFPPMFAPLPLLGWLPGSVVAVLMRGLSIRAAQRLPFTFGLLAKRPIPQEVVASYLRPLLGERGIRRDLARFLRSVHRRHTIAAAERLSTFDKPVSLIWAEEDRLFPISLAHRLAAVLPQAHITPVSDSYTFIPEDQPEQLSDLILEHAQRVTSTT